MPAPVTTTIFLLFATEREMSERVRRVGASVRWASRLRVTVIVGVSRDEREWFNSQLWMFNQRSRLIT
jgi:hypothetical protein